MCYICGMANNHFLHIGNKDIPAHRMDEEAMTQVERMKAHFADRGAASIVREAIRELYKKYEKDMTSQVRQIKWTPKSKKGV